MAFFITLLSMIKVISIITALFLGFSSCSTLEADQPTVIKINAIDLKTNYNLEGSSSHKISDAWIYIDDQLQGAFELPCAIPFSQNGNVKITVVPGIKSSGQTAIREKYPYYKWCDSLVNMSGSTITLYPTTQYIDSTSFLYKDDFESNAIVFTKDNNSDTSMYIVSGGANIFEGNNIAEICVNNNNPYALVKSMLNLSTPSSSKKTYLEMDYANDAPLIVGIKSGGNFVPIIILNSTALAWNKIYIDLSQTLANNNSQSKFEIYFEIQQISGEENRTRFDNLKIVTRK